ncbi:HNH endonuclease signature motif containing protein [Microbacterium sp. ASV49]|uniref:DUF222 domain-containing protein n=1 Tax=Microbacterium candidum TaxID=3041922 RepID=A0ABT7N0F9_9MICO|nr:HNH endonuclease signature motif containing protein [Microbacterium sp. ASV49]MDL9980171.1 DUF222 domain-containing protein [Microbacterium sp. ASV49]
MSVAPRPGSGGSLLSPALQALDGIVQRLVANQRSIAALEAEQRELLAACADVIPARAAELRGDRRRYSTDLPAREVVSEVAVALRVGERGIQARLNDASLLVSSFPGSLDALRQGRIDTRHVGVILDAGAMLEQPADRAQFERAVLPIAERESAPRLRGHARALAASIDPDAVDRRVEDAQSRRTVRMYDLDDDLSRLILDQPATLIHAIYDRVTQQAKAFRAASTEAGDALDGDGDDPAEMSSARRGTDVPGLARVDASAESAAPAQAEETGDGGVDAQSAGSGATCETPKSPVRARVHGETDDAGMPAREAIAVRDPGETDDDRVMVVTRPGRAQRESAPDATDLHSGPGRDAVMAAESAADGVEDRRTLDQIRADVLADLLLTGAPTGHGAGLEAIRAIVHVTVPLEALVGAIDAEDAAGTTMSPHGNDVTAEKRPDDRFDLDLGADLGAPGDPRGLGRVERSFSPPTRAGAAILSTFGAIPIATARTLAGHTPGWERVCLDATTGLPVAVDRYKPTARQRAYLTARDERCRFPGCVRPAHRCDLDHTHDAALGGATCVCNLAHFCRRHHTIKHHTAWTVRQLGGGVLEWRSPTGRRYEDRPPAMVRFMPSSGEAAGGSDRETKEDRDAPPF